MGAWRELLLLERRAQLFLLRLRVFLQTPNIDSELLLERFGFFRIARSQRLTDLILEKQLFLRNARFKGGLNFRHLLLLLVGERETRRLLLEPLHRQFVSGFHYRER